jgi:hypothetical protein
MIQRRQNLYLFIILAVAMILSFSNFKIASFSFIGDTEEAKALTNIDMTYSHNFAMDNEIIVASINSAKVRIALWVISALSLFTILSFKNLKRQITLSSFLLAVILFLPIFYYLDYSSLHNVYDLGDAQYPYTAIIPLALVILNILAIQGVLRDYNLLKSMDRIR